MIANLNIHVRKVSDLELGKKRLTDSIIDKLIESVGVSDRWLLCSEGDIFSARMSRNLVGANVGKTPEVAVSDYYLQKNNEIKYIKNNLDLLRTIAKKKIKYNNLFFNNLSENESSLHDLYKSIGTILDFEIYYSQY